MDDNAVPAGGQSEGRPYRSHMQPACVACRARKSRCKTSQASSTCFTCQLNGTECVFPPSLQRERKRRRLLKATSGATQHITTSNDSWWIALQTSPGHGSHHVREQRSHSAQVQPYHQSSAVADNLPNDVLTAEVSSEAGGEEGSSHIVSPAIAEDDRVFQEYLSNISYGPNGRTIRFHPHTYGGLTRPIVFNTIPKRGAREAESRAEAAAKFEVVERMISPHQADLLDL
jgi:hypothetical protein